MFVYRGHLNQWQILMAWWCFQKLLILFFFFFFFLGPHLQHMKVPRLPPLQPCGSSWGFSTSLGLAQPLGLCTGCAFCLLPRMLSPRYPCGPSPHFPLVFRERDLFWLPYLKVQFCPAHHVYYSLYHLSSPPQDSWLISLIIYLASWNVHPMRARILSALFMAVCTTDRLDLLYRRQAVDIW